MNFFTLSSNDYDYKLTIPRFTNSGKILSKLNLYTLGITRKNFKIFGIIKYYNQTTRCFILLKIIQKIWEILFSWNRKYM